MTRYVCFEFYIDGYRPPNDLTLWAKKGLGKSEWAVSIRGKTPVVLKPADARKVFAEYIKYLDNKGISFGVEAFDVKDHSTWIINRPHKN